MRSEELRAVGAHSAALSLLVMKHGRDRDLLERLPEWGELWRWVHRPRELRLHTLERVLRYILETNKYVDAADLGSALAPILGPEVRNMAITGEGKALRKGRAEGEAAEARRSLLQLLASRFGDLPEAVQQRIATAETPQLRGWFEAALGATSLGAVIPSTPTQEG